MPTYQLSMRSIAAAWAANYPSLVNKCPGGLVHEVQEASDVQHAVDAFHHHLNDCLSSDDTDTEAIRTTYDFFDFFSKTVLDNDTEMMSNHPNDDSVMVQNQSNFEQINRIQTLLEDLLTASRFDTVLNYYSFLKSVYRRTNWLNGHKMLAWLFPGKIERQFNRLDAVLDDAPEYIDSLWVEDQINMDGFHREVLMDLDRLFEDSRALIDEHGMSR